MSRNQPNDLRRQVRRTVLCDWFGIPGREATVLAVLTDADGQSLRAGDLARIAHISTTSIPVAICNLRKVMETEAIDWTEQGYRLTEIGTSEVKRALIMMGQTLLPESAR